MGNRLINEQITRIFGPRFGFKEWVEEDVHFMDESIIKVVIHVLDVVVVAVWY